MPFLTPKLIPKRVSATGIKIDTRASTVGTMSAANPFKRTVTSFGSMDVPSPKISPPF
jgi:hypothetical protein